MPRRLLIECLRLLANALVFLVAFFVGLRVVYNLVFRLLGLGRIGPGVESAVALHYALVGSIIAAFMVVGLLTVVWTRNVLTVLIPAATMFLFGMLMVAQAIYITDRGDPSVMWEYVRPRSAEYIGAACAGAAAAVGSYAGSRIRLLRRKPVDSEVAS
jgi:hypothetical protein